MLEFYYFYGYLRTPLVEFPILPSYLELRLRLVYWRVFLNTFSILSFRSFPCAHP